MEGQGAAIHLPQAQMNAQQLAELLQNMTRARCLHMAEAAYQNGRRDANAAIADVLESLVKTA
jgi:UDP-N-acetylglucosamine--N-acetylmuramyl-(pentapeptide) pyrophosphoryl-undecaprenol N-acetylglucosamine transferase